MREHRRYPRRRVLLEGRILFSNRSMTIDCTVRDLSRTGVQVVIPGTAIMPSTVELKFPTLGRTVPARIVWSVGDSYGLDFLEPDLQPATRALLDEVRRKIAGVEGVSPDAVTVRVFVDR